jgi:hypothetical protein
MSVVRSHIKEARMTVADVQPFVQMTATIVAISGGLLGLYKYFSDKRARELREWQKVVIYKIFRQNETKVLGFIEILEKYRIEAQAFVAVDLKKTEISEDALRRVLLELTSSNILSFELNDSFRLKVAKAKSDPLELLERLNQELVRVVAPNPFVYTLDEVLKEISPKVGIEIPLLRNTLRQSIDQGFLVLDDKDRIAFPK